MIDSDRIPAELWKQVNISREDFDEVMARQAACEKNAPTVGSRAPDFELGRLDDRGRLGEETLRLELAMPVLLDKMSNEVDLAYSALPERLYAIDRDGIITWRSGPGPWGFDVDSWEREIARLAKR